MPSSAAPEMRILWSASWEGKFLWGKTGIVKICGVEKSPKFEKAEAFASVFRSEGRSPERRETDAARVAARRTQCVAGQAMVIMFAFAHSLYGTGGIPPGLNDVILILL